LAETRSPSGIPAIDAVLPGLRLLGPSGFIFAYNITFRGPEFFHSEYPKAWQVEYESRSYAYFDPVLLWNIMNVGDRRWSDVKLPDLRGVLREARKHGLNYGASFSRNRRGKKSILTISRADREFADEEMAFLSATFERIMDDIDGGDMTGLTPAELETLRCLRDGMSYAEVAELLKISVPTVKARVEKSRGKLGARNATQAVALALQRKLI
jgi:LuxR family transcriptional regulator, quorum-sensing system regulator SdiA